MSKKFSCTFKYSQDDSYIRAIRPDYIRRNGEIKAAAFKSNRGGVSVTRTNEAHMEEALDFMRFNFQGKMGVFSRAVCDQTQIEEVHSPTPGYNEHHWELYGNSSMVPLSGEQILEIVQNTKLM